MSTNDAKPWVTAELIDTERRVTEAGSYFHVDFDLTLATCKQRDELLEALSKAVNLTCNCANDPEFKVLGHAPFCDARAVLAKWGAP